MGDISRTISPAVPVEDSKPCSSDIFYVLIIFCIACGIILILTLLEKRNNRKKCKCLRGHLGLVIPVNLLDHNNDRISIAAAFGSMASDCFHLMIVEGNLENVPEWSKTFFVMALVVIMGLLYYPIFACMSTKRTFVGNFLGAAFSTCLFGLNLKTVLNCASSANAVYLDQVISTQLPVFICQCFLMLRFLWKFIHHAYLTVKRRGTLEEEQKQLSEPHNVSYVKNLLHKPTDGHWEMENLSNTQAQGRMQRITRKIPTMRYKNDLTFKYSPRIIAIFSVSVICIYQISVLLILVAIDLSTTVAGFNLTLPFEILLGCFLISFVVSLSLTIWSSFQILTNYRRILKAMFKGDFKAVHFKRSDFKAQTIVSDSLAYAGSQIAYILWGYIVSFTFVAVACLLITYLVILPLTGDVPFSVFKYSVLNILPGFVIMGVFGRIQSLLSRFLIQKADFVDENGQPTTKRVLALDNRKAYHVVSFFLFLFHIVLDLFGCLLTIIKGIILGVIYLSRLDRCRLMQGFESSDEAYLYFISFMYVEESHRHPVLLVFCDALLEKHHTKKPVELENVTSSATYPGTDPHSTTDFRSCVGRSLSTTPRARLRWLKAYTLIRNPNLIVKDDHVFEEVGR